MKFGFSTAWGVGTPNPCMVQGSAVFQIKQLPTESLRIDAQNRQMRADPFFVGIFTFGDLPC